MSIVPLAGERLSAALRALAARDRAVGDLLDRLGPPPARVIPAGFSSLVRIIVGQQVSTRAAATVFQRLEARFGGDLPPAAVLASGLEALRGCGLSGGKAGYVLALAEAVEAGRLDLDGLALLADDAVVDVIRGQRGLGRWSGEIYAMFALGRADIMPADDLAVQVGLQRLKGLGERPAATAVRALTAAWSPYRSAGALMLWRLYGATTLAPASRE